MCIKFVFSSSILRANQSETYRREGKMNQAHIVKEKKIDGRKKRKQKSYKRSTRHERSILYFSSSSSDYESNKNVSETKECTL